MIFAKLVNFLSWLLLSFALGWFSNGAYRDKQSTRERQIAIEVKNENQRLAGKIVTNNEQRLVAAQSVADEATKAVQTLRADNNVLVSKLRDATTPSVQTDSTTGAAVCEKQLERTRAVFNQCTAELTTLAGRADELMIEVAQLRSAWPRN